MKQIPKLLFLSGTVFVTLSAHAQSVGPATLDASGNSATVGGITHEYAIGQVVAGNTFNSSALVVTPGVLQPFSTTGIKTQAIAADNLQVFPSPVETTLFLQPAFNGSGLLQYRLYDAAGKLVASEEAKLERGSEKQSMDVTRVAAGQYTLQVSWTQAGNAYMTAYKVQKLK